MQRVDACITVQKNDVLQFNFEGCKSGDWIQLLGPVAATFEHGNESFGPKHFLPG
jgi:hypothetical protein